MESSMMLERSCCPSFQYVRQGCVTHIQEAGYPPTNMATSKVEAMELHRLCVNIHKDG